MTDRLGDIKFSRFSASLKGMDDGPFESSERDVEPEAWDIGMDAVWTPTQTFTR